MSLCNPPPLSLPNPPDILSAIIQALGVLGIHIPPMPSIPLPAPFCPLD